METRVVLWKRLSSTQYPDIGVSSSPPPSPQEKNPQPTQKRLPIKSQDFLITNAMTQVQIPWVVPIYESTVQTSQRILVQDE